MKDIKATILSGKYRICHELGRGRSGIVYLAVHQELEEYRAIKCISKNNADYQQFLQEAHLMRDLRHPAFPIIYDLAEDATYSYLIEEYLSGETLQAIVSKQGPLSRAMMIHYGIQICCLVRFLHSKSNPILFLDLQPQNLLLCDDVLKLVDFGQAVCAGEVKQLTKRYGTVGYAAPEQYTAEILDERTDLYAIGAVLYYLLTGKSPQSIPSYPCQLFDPSLERILRKCLAPLKAERYPSVAELEQALRSLSQTTHDGMEEPADLSLTIAVAGAKAGVGTTHAAVGLSAYLLQCGYSPLYEEWNSSGAIRRMADWFSLAPDTWGCIQVKGLRFLPKYGPAASFKPMESSCIIQDYGTEWSAISLHQVDAVFFICGSRWWEQEAGYAAFETLKNHPGLVLIYNHISGQKIVLPSKAKRTMCFPMPFFPDPFTIHSRTIQFYKQSLKAALQDRKELDYRCCEHSFWQKISKKFPARRQKRSGL